jgi:hypothetical protein
MLLMKQRRRRLDRLGAGRRLRHDPAARLGHLIGQFVLGSGLAYLAFMLTSDASLPPFARWDYIAIAGFAVIAGAVTNYDAERIRIEQERAMLATAGSIAHELRTPLLGIRAGATGLGNYLPTLVESYRWRKRSGLPVGADPQRPPRPARRRCGANRRRSPSVKRHHRDAAGECAFHRRRGAGTANVFDFRLRRGGAAALSLLRRRARAGFLAERRRVRVSGHRAAHGARPLQLDQERAAPHRPGKKGRNHDAHRGLVHAIA